MYTFVQIDIFDHFNLRVNQKYQKYENIENFLRIQYGNNNIRQLFFYLYIFILYICIIILYLIFNQRTLFEIHH